MRKISTGEDSTLKTYRRIAYMLDGFTEGKAVEFIDRKIKESPNGEDEEVIADERQLIFLLGQLATESYGKEEIVNIKVTKRKHNYNIICDCCGNDTTSTYEMIVGRIMMNICNKCSCNLKNSINESVK